MIQINDIITLLRTGLDSSWTVYGAAELYEAQDKVRLALPCFYVCLGNFSATLVSKGALNILQEYDERIKIILGAPSTNDRSGVIAQQMVYVARNALFQQLFNRQLSPAVRPISYIGDQFLTMDKARYYHQFEFSVTGQLSADDGYKPDYGPLDLVVNTYNVVDSDPLDKPNITDHITLT